MQRHYLTYDKEFSMAFIVGNIISFTRILSNPASTILSVSDFFGLVSKFLSMF